MYTESQHPRGRGGKWTGKGGGGTGRIGAGRRVAAKTGDAYEYEGPRAAKMAAEDAAVRKAGPGKMYFKAASKGTIGNSQPAKRSIPVKKKTR